VNEMIEQWDRQDDARWIDSRSRPIAEDFALEQPLSIPEEPSEAGWLFLPPASRPLRTGPGPSTRTAPRSTSG
jgi:hypothetical protein